jgi:hypothetical protein
MSEQQQVNRPRRQRRLFAQAMPQVPQPVSETNQTQADAVMSQIVAEIAGRRQRMRVVEDDDSLTDEQLVAGNIQGSGE